MGEVKRVEVYYNEWTGKHTVIIVPEGDSFDTAFKVYDTFAEVEEILEKFKENFPEVEIKIYE